MGYLSLRQAKTWSEEALQRAPHSCHCVAFRLDDIQDYFAREAQIDLIRMFLEENVPLTIGVIGGFLHDDRELIRFLRQAASAGVEVANHGWVHSDHTLLTADEQRRSIARTNGLIRTLFGVEATTFIPPENPFNDQTLSIMREIGMTHISGSIFLKPDAPPYPLKNADTIFHFPQTAFVNSVNSLGIWTTLPNDRIIQMIRFSVRQFGFVVVVIHPVAYYDKTDSGYVHNQGRLASLRALLQEAKKEFRVVRMSEIDRQEWIPDDVPSNVRLHNYTVSWKGSRIAVASSEAVNIEAREESLILGRAGKSWAGQVVLLFPRTLTPVEPLITADGAVLPALRWFNPHSGTWIVYVDPPKSAGSLRVVPRRDLSTQG